MMGAAVDINKTLKTMHNDVVRAIFAETAERLVKEQDFVSLRNLDRLAEEYESLSRKYFGLQQTARNLQEQNESYRRTMERYR